MTQVRPRESVAAGVVLGTLLIAGGVLLLLERMRTDGLHLWPILLVILGLSRLSAAPWEQHDEALVLVGTGLWLLVDGTAPVALTSAGPAILTGAGLATLWTTLVRLMPRSGQEPSHVN